MSLAISKILLVGAILFSVHAHAKGAALDARFCDRFFRKAAATQFSEIEPVVRNWIEARTPPPLMQIPALRNGEQIQVGRLSVTILHYLGVGGEGVVYLGQTSEGLVTVKTYFDATLFKRGLLGVRAYQNALPKILAQDRSNNSIAMEYREGIPISTIFSYDGTVTGWQRSLVYARWLRWRTTSAFLRMVGRHPEFWDSNVLYSFKDLTFYFIDPG